MSVRINGKSYDWGDISVKTPYGDFEPQSIDYDDELEKEAVYGRGNMPRGYGTGNYKASCKMSFLLDDYEQLEDICKQRGVSLYKLLIPKIVVAYANDGDRPRIDEITKVGITKVANKGQQGDKNITVDVECGVFGKIVRNGVSPI